MIALPMLATEKFTQALREASIRIIQTNTSDASRNLSDILNYIADNAAVFDKNCEVTLKSLGNRIYDLLIESTRMLHNGQTDILNVLMYRMIIEYDISTNSDLPIEVQSFKSHIEESEDIYPENLKRQLRYVRQNLPITILKKLLNSENSVNFKNLKNFSNSVENNIQNWDEQLKNQQKNAERLGELFEKHAKDFNFSGLHTGFSDMAKRIKTELRFSQVGMFFFGLFLLTPACLDLYLAYEIFTKPQVYPSQALIAAAVASVTLTLLFLYFFRIALRKADSCRAQLLQIHLRMSLCRFIQPYTDYSKDVKEKHAETFSKFEALIFSGIVGSSEKIPSTFDGLDQIAALIKSFKGDK